MAPDAAALALVPTHWPTYPGASRGAPGVGEQTDYDNQTLQLDFLRHNIRIRGRQLDLTPLEFRLLTVLVNNLSGMVMSTDGILDLVWGEAQVKLGDSPVYENASLHLDFLRHIVRVSGRDVRLTPTEFRLLTVLVNNAGLVMSIERLLDLVWGGREVGDASVRAYISSLRRKLEMEGGQGPVIETVREFGYRYNPPGDTALEQ